MSTCEETKSSVEVKNRELASKCCVCESVFTEIKDFDFWEKDNVAKATSGDIVVKGTTLTFTVLASQGLLCEINICLKCLSGFVKKHSAKGIKQSTYEALRDKLTEFVKSVFLDDA